MMLNVRGVPKEVPPEVYRSVERAAWALAEAVDHLAAAPLRPVVDEWIIDRMYTLRHILYDLDQALEADA
jgi:hypothetical protein